MGLSSSASGTQAFRWTLSTGIVGLGDFPKGSFNSRARGVSADGSAVAGQGNKTSFINEAFRWTSDSGLVGLGDLPGGTMGSDGWGMSANGEVIVGQSVAGGSPGASNIHAFRWTQATNSMTDLGTLSANNSFGSWANAVSGDGLVAVGASNSSPGNQAFRWTQGGGMVGLGDLTGGDFVSEAFGVSFDGAVVVGESTSGNGTREAFRWTQAIGMVGLGDLPGGSFRSSAKGVSGDGSIIVGYGTLTNSARAFIWDEANQMRLLQDVLVNEYGLGAALTGWTLNEATAISSDGQYITGYATNPTGGTEGWLLSFAPTIPMGLPGDFNGDQHVDVADYTVWCDNLGTDFDLHGNGDEEGNSAGTVDQADYALWNSHFGSQGSGSNATQTPEPATLLLLAFAGLCVLGISRPQCPSVIPTN